MEGLQAESLALLAAAAPADAAGAAALLALAGAAVALPLARAAAVAGALPAVAARPHPLPHKVHRNHALAGELSDRPELKAIGDSAERMLLERAAAANAEATMAVAVAWGRPRLQARVHGSLCAPVAWARWRHAVRADGHASPVIDAPQTPPRRRAARR